MDLNLSSNMSKHRPASMPGRDRVRASFELITQRASLIRALYIVSVATHGPRDVILQEFHQAVGDVLEGMAFSKLNLTYISKDKVREEAAWLRERK
jgi:hypothetical protein